MSELENNLIHLYQSFFADTPYQETLRMSLKTENSSRLPESLQTLYRTIGNVPELMKSEFGYFYPIEDIKTNSWHFKCKHHEGFMFGTFDDFCFHLYPQIPTWANGIADTVTKWNSNCEFEMWAEFPDVEDELLYLSFNNAIWNADYLCSVTSRKLMKTYQSVLCDEFGMTLFTAGREQACMLYSETDHILARFGDYDHNKLLIASNSLESNEKISKKYKIKWLKKGGKKEEMTVTAISDTPLLTTSERLNAISEICYGKKPTDNLDKKLSQIEERLQLSLPDSLKQYYQLFQKQKLMMESGCSVVQLSELAFTENGKIKVASNFEGDGECYYFTTDKMIHVEYENDDTLILNTDDFIIMLALYQSSFVMKNNGLLANDKIPSKLYQILIDNRSWIISRNYKLLGIPFNDTQCMLFSKRSSDLNKAEKLLHFSLSSL
jgi:hypothetical protein